MGSILSQHALVKVSMGDALLRLRGLHSDHERFLALQPYGPLLAFLAKSSWEKEITPQVSQRQANVHRSKTGLSSNSLISSGGVVVEGELEDTTGWALMDPRFCHEDHGIQVILKFQHKCRIVWKRYLCKTITTQQFFPEGGHRPECHIKKYVHNVALAVPEATSEV